MIVVAIVIEIYFILCIIAKKELSSHLSHFHMSMGIGLSLKRNGCVSYKISYIDALFLEKIYFQRDSLFSNTLKTTKQTTNNEYQI